MASVMSNQNNEIPNILKPAKIRSVFVKRYLIWQYSVVFLGTNENLRWISILKLCIHHSFSNIRFQNFRIEQMNWTIYCLYLDAYFTYFILIEFICSKHKSQKSIVSMVLCVYVPNTQKKMPTEIPTHQWNLKPLKTQLYL